MYLDEWLKANGVKRSDFAKKIKCTYPYLCEVINGRKPGPHFKEAVKKATKWKIQYKELSGGRKSSNSKQKQNKNHAQEYVCAPSQNSISPHCRNEILQTTHDDLHITLTVNNQILFSKTYKKNKQHEDKCNCYVEIENIDHEIPSVLG